MTHYTRWVAPNGEGTQWGGAPNGEAGWNPRHRGPVRLIGDRTVDSALGAHRSPVQEPVCGDPGSAFPRIVEQADSHGGQSELAESIVEGFQTQKHQRWEQQTQDAEHHPA